MKRVVLFIDNLGSGGAQRQVVNIAALLKNNGYDVSVLVYADTPFYKKNLDDNGIPVHLVSSDGKVSRMLKVRKYLRRSGADIVIAFLEAACFMACFSKMGGGKFKVVTTERSAKLSTFTARRNKIFNRFERFADAKIGNSQNAMDMWAKYYPQYKDKYGVIYNAVIIPNELMQAVPSHRDDGKLRLTVAASYQELKNPIKVIEAVRRMDDRYRARLDLQWYGRIEVTTGNTRIYDKAQDLIAEYGLTDCICLNPETNQIYDVMLNSDAVGLFSTVEGFPNAICEAMMLSKPVIMSKVSDYGVIVNNNGFLCDPFSVESIKEAIEKMLDASDEELHNMGIKSRETAEKLFSREATIQQWIDLIERLTK